MCGDKLCCYMIGRQNQAMRKQLILPRAFSLLLRIPPIDSTVLNTANTQDTLSSLLCTPKRNYGTHKQRDIFTRAFLGAFVRER